MKKKNICSTFAISSLLLPSTVAHCLLFIAYCLLPTAFVMLSEVEAFSQGTAINTTGNAAVASSILDITSTDKGLLIPRMTTAQRNAIASPATGLWIYNTDCNEFQYYNASNWVSLINGNSLPVTSATAATNMQQTSLSANWNSVTGATTFYLDVSTASDFSSFVTGYNNLNVGNVVTYGVTGLICNTTYYYRIRAGNTCSASSNSEIITAITSACPPPPCAQLQRIFGGTVNDESTSVLQTIDGGYVFAGYTSSFGGASGNNPYLLKTDLNGDFVWNKHYNTANAIIYCMYQASDGGFILSGASSNGSNQDFYLLKTDAGGAVLWNKIIGSATGNDIAFSVQQTTDGGYIFAGYTDGYGAGANDIYLVKTDGSGNISWSKTYGSTGSEFAYSVRQTSDGGYVIAGSTSSWGVYNGILIKTDGSGNVSWCKTYGGAISEITDFVKQTTDGGFIIAGTTESYGLGGNGDIYLVKTDGSGNIAWTKTYGSTGSDQIYDQGSVMQTADGGFVLVGRTSSYGAGNYDVFLIKIDASGNLSWAKTFGGSNYDDGRSIQQTTDGGYIIGAFTESFGAGFKDVYLIKTDANGDAGGCNTSSPSPTVGSGGSATNRTPTVTSPASGISAPTPTINTPVPTVSTPCSNC